MSIYRDFFTQNSMFKNHRSLFSKYWLFLEGTLGGDAALMSSIDMVDRAREASRFRADYDA